MSALDDARRYSAVSDHLGTLAKTACLTLAGFCCCIDRVMDLAHVAGPLLAHPDPRATALAEELRRRAAAGIGGELCVDWPDGPSWLDAHCDAPPSLGGTAAQAASALAMLGAPVLLAVQDRTPRQLSLIHPDVRLATEGGITSVRQVSPGSMAGRASHYIFEYARDADIAGVTAPRATRVIVRFADDGMDDDPAFVATSMEVAPQAGAAILAGFNSLSSDQLDRSLAVACNVVVGWRRAGLRWVHLELSDFPNPATRAEILTALRGKVTSLGMNHNELHGLQPGDAPVDAKAIELAQKMSVDRVCIHADDWALSITRGDPVQEHEALLAGCLLAATRAQCGRLKVPTGPPLAAIYRTLPAFVTPRPPGWHATACAAPYLTHPRTTLGLGDTFLAGTLLVLGQTNPATTKPWEPR
jgi:ADP-dependent phosphofructokinase/glucokinase